MISRCENPNTPWFRNYGGRAISVAPEWRQSAQAFMDYIGPRPGPEYSVDRIDVNKGYEPGNVRWATQAQQMRNTRSNRLVNINGENICLIDAAADTSLKYNTILYRIKRGTDTAAALAAPLSKGRRI